MNKKTLLALALLAILVSAALVILQNVTIFEDGSFILGPLHGCLPGGLCNLGG